MAVPNYSRFFWPDIRIEAISTNSAVRVYTCTKHCGLLVDTCVPDQEVLGVMG